MVETVDRETVIRAWRDPEFRLGLSDVERSLIPDSPAGSIEIPDLEIGTPRAMTAWTIIMSAMNFCVATDTCNATDTC